MLKRLFGIFFICLPILISAQELELSTIKAQNSNLVGKVHFKKWFFDIYDAELFTNTGKFNWDLPFLLKIHYLIDLQSKSIVTQTLKEISKQHPNEVKDNYQNYLDTFKMIIPNVAKNTNLYGYMDKDGYANIYSDTRLLGTIQNKGLSKYFFEIWLSDKSSNIKLSKQLRGI
ncbi:putative periplasmic protein [Francisella sp. W12-1067]|nr:putative periplasmic protein [Francisella sp. W12-1067]